MARTLALVTASALAVGGCATVEPEPVVVAYFLEDAGTPAVRVGDETYRLTEDERVTVANALIAEYFEPADWCPAD